MNNLDSRFLRKYINNEQLVKELGLTTEEKASFVDVNSQHWSAGLDREGVALGDNGKFRPNEPMTRAQFAVFLHRIMQR